MDLEAVHCGLSGETPPFLPCLAEAPWQVAAEPAALAEAFGPARAPWVRSILLGDGRSTDASALASANLSTLCGVSVRIALRADALAVDERTDVALLPTVRGGTVTAGIAVSISSGGTRSGRFVSDASSGNVLIIAATGSVAEAVFASHRGGARGARSYFRFHGPALRAALSAPTLDPQALAAAATASTTLTEVRIACPICAARGAGGVGCTCAQALGVHGKGYALLTTDMTRMLGAFAGVGVAVAGGAAARTHSAVDVRPMADPTATARAVAAAALEGVLGAAVGSSPGDNGPLHLPEQSLPCSLADDIGELRMPLGLNGGAGVAGLSFLGSGEAAALSPVSEHSETSLPVGTGAWDGPLLPLPPAARSAPELPLPWARGALNSERVALPLRKPARRRAGKRIVSEEVLREREARRQIRVFKNRAAAARSNARRKMQNDALKGALADIRGRALHLRDRQMALREENLRLKTMLLM